MGNSTYTLQNVVDDAISYGEIQPVLNVPGYENAPALAIANTVMTNMLAPSFPQKWNEIIIPPFYSSSFQQDYAIPGLTTLAWLQRGTALDVNNTAIPKPRFLVEVGRSLPQASANQTSVSFLSNPKFIINWFPNDQLYYGTWGGSSSSSGNDPVALQVITNPLSPGTSQPSNPITQIKDSNGNFLVLTTYGTTGASAPTAAVKAAPGITVNDGTCVWTVVDAKGQGMRLIPVPSQTGIVWQFNLVGQARPVKLTTLGQSLDPIPDDYYEYFRQGFIAHCFMRSPEEKTRKMGQVQFQLWQAALAEARQKSDRERDECGFVPDSPLISSYGGGYQGAAWPYPYPVR